eukprot:g8104.t1
MKYERDSTRHIASLFDTQFERLLVAERWQRLTSYLSQAAGRAEPGQVTEEPASGADQVLEVLMLGLRLSEAAGRKASKEDGAEGLASGGR